MEHNIIEWGKRIKINTLSDRDLVEKYRWNKHRTEQVNDPLEKTLMKLRSSACFQILIERGFTRSQIKSTPLYKFENLMTPKPNEVVNTGHWQTHIMKIAELVALKSKDSTKVGAVLVGDNNVVLLTAFNGAPIGVLDIPERLERPEKYKWASHAETNLIAFAAREGVRTEGRAVYSTHMPCAACARTLIQAGIKRVIVGRGSFSVGSQTDDCETSTIMFAEAGVSFERT